MARKNPDHRITQPHARSVHAELYPAQAQAQEDRRQQDLALSLRTVHLRKVPWAKDTLEIQALILRREGMSYAQIGHELEVGQTIARKLVEDGARLCLDEEPVTALRVHMLRLDRLLELWTPRAEPPADIAIPDEASIEEVRHLLYEARATTKDSRESATLVLQILALYDKVGTWLAALPRRGQAPPEDDHAEIKAILLRADEYAVPAPGQGTVPHGLPSIDWKPGNIEE